MGQIGENGSNMWNDNNWLKLYFQIGSLGFGP